MHSPPRTSGLERYASAIDECSVHLEYFVSARARLRQLAPARGVLHPVLVVGLRSARLVVVVPKRAISPPGSPSDLARTAADRVATARFDASSGGKDGLRTALGLKYAASRTRSRSARLPVAVVSQAFSPANEPLFFLASRPEPTPIARYLSRLSSFLWTRPIRPPCSTVD